MMIIYKTTNLVNGKIYVGKDSNNNPKYFGSGLIIGNALKKYGKHNFIKEILDTATSFSELNEKEKYWIKKLNCLNPFGYNIGLGGEGGDIFTNHPNKEEIRFKSSKNRTPHLYTKEDRKKISDRIKKKIYQFDKKGIYKNYYESLDEALRYTKSKSKGNLSSVANGIRNFFDGYRWSFNDYPNQLLKIEKTGRKKGTKNSYKIKRNHVNINYVEVRIYKGKKLIKCVKGYVEAARFLKLSKQMICKACNNKSPYKGYYFKKGKNIKETQKNG